jgi:transposase-like protein
LVISRKRFSAEDIVNKLREADVELARGKTVSVVCKQIGITDQTYFRWRKEYGGLKVDQARRFKELEQENAHLKRDGVLNAPGDRVLHVFIRDESSRAAIRPFASVLLHP